MSSTTFVDQVTPVPASWLNDVNTATYTSSSVPSLTALTSVNGGQLAGLRNRIINGDMRIDQRNNGSAYTNTNTQPYGVDRWQCLPPVSAPGKLSTQQVIDGPAGFKYSTKITVLATYAPAATDAFNFRQTIEGQATYDFQLGTIGSKTVTGSVWVKGSVAGNYNCFLFDVTANRSFVGVVAVTNSWAQQSVVFTPVTGATFDSSTGAGLQFGIDLGSGANLVTTPGIWQVGVLTRSASTVTFVSQTVGATLNVTGFQLELGSVATPFEQRPYGLELALCQRYYEILPNIQFVAYSSSGNYIGQTHPFKVTKRAVPTVSGTSSYANTSGMSTTPSIDGIYTIALVTALGAASWQYTNVSASAEL